MRTRRSLALFVPLALALLAAALWLTREAGEPARDALEPASAAPRGPGAVPAAGSRASGATQSGLAAAAGARHDPLRASEASAPGAPPAELGPEEAELAVRVLGREASGEEQPLEGVGLHLLPADQPELEVRRVSRTRARLGEAPATGEEGEASFVVPAGRAWSLRSVPRPGLWGASETSVRALEAGERYLATLVVPLGGDLALRGRVLRAADGAPIEGASVHVHALGVERIGASQLARPSGGRGDATTDAQGRFALASTSWERNALLVEAAGHAPRCVLAPEVPEEGELAPLEIRLEPAAGLELALRAPGGEPLAGLEARLSINAAALAGLERLDAPPLTRSASSDADGLARLADLPGGVALELELFDPRAEGGRGGLVYRAPRALVLGPGESRRLELVVPAPDSLRGRLVDQRGRPVANHPVWLVPDRGEELVVFFAHARPLRESVSDEQGYFALPRVPAGRWWVGPAPLPAGDARPLEERVAPLAQALEHAPGPRGEPVELRVVRGLGLAGALRDPEGQPLAGVIVRAAGLDSPLAVEASSDERGRFALGPLVPGAFRVLARPSAELGLASPPAADFEAGRADLELVLVRAASLEGLVHGAGAAQGEAEVALVPEDSESAVGWRPARTREGRFRFAGLPPGRYALVASRPDGRVCVARGFELEAGRDIGGIGLDLERGARLSVRSEGAREPWLCEVFADGLLVDYATCAPQESAELVAPAGAVRVIVQEPGGRAAEDELELAPGRRKILRLRPR